jgi:hypothetical protein
VNGDAKLDLVVANNNSNTLSVLLGNGAGSFGVKTDFATGVSPRSVAIGEVNGDNKPDLAIANGGDATVSVLPGNGDGTFGAKVDFCIGSGPASVAIADLDGNGQRDLVVANSGSNTVSVLLNSRTTAVDPAPTTPPPTFVLFAPRPNPTQGSSTFAFALPTAQRVRADVLDLSGRLIARISNDESFAAGTHALTWDGRTSSGAKAANGIYLVRVSAGSYSATRKLIIVAQ